MLYSLRIASWGSDMVILVKMTQKEIEKVIEVFRLNGNEDFAALKLLDDFEQIRMNIEEKKKAEQARNRPEETERITSVNPTSVEHIK